jgi:hypothetical protein
VFGDTSIVGGFSATLLFSTQNNMKDLYVWLQSEVNKSLELLDNEIIKDGADEIVFSSSKEFLKKSKEVLNRMVDLLSEYDLDIMKLINLIAKLKTEGNDADEDVIIQSMILKMLETSSLETKSR